MPRPKGSPNKVTAEVKEQLQNLIDTVVNRLDVDAMTTDHEVFEHKEGENYEKWVDNFYMPETKECLV